MNPLTNIKRLTAMNEQELSWGVAGTDKSWHRQYRDSAWIFAGGLPYDLTEGDLLAVFSQWGEIVHINLVRDQATGKSKGFGFVCYEDQRSTDLAVDNFNGVRLVGRTIRVDHVETYKLPKDLEKMDADRKRLFLEGCAPKPLENPHLGNPDDEEEDSEEEGESNKKKKKKKKEKKKKKKRKRSSSLSDREEEQTRKQRGRSASPSPPRKSRRGDTRERRRGTPQRSRSPAVRPRSPKSPSPPRKNRKGDTRERRGTPQRSRSPPVRQRSPKRTSRSPERRKRSPERRRRRSPEDDRRRRREDRR